MPSSEVIQAYFKDRLSELRQQLDHGNPFVFLGAAAILNGLAELGGASEYRFLAVRMGANKFLNGMHGSKFGKFAWSHDTSEDRKLDNNGRQIISAHPLLNEIELEIDKVFARTEPADIEAVFHDLFGYN